MKKLLTLIIIHQHPKILLGMKKRRFGAGKWNGFGGKVASGEKMEEAARRELREEACIEAGPLQKMGVIDFEFPGNSEALQVHVFRSESFVGEPMESEEMRPKWFHVDDIPFDDMWSDDRYWMPLFLEGKKFRGRFSFDESDEILEKDLQEVDEI